VSPEPYDFQSINDAARPAVTGGASEVEQPQVRELAVALVEVEAVAAGGLVPVSYHHMKPPTNPRASVSVVSSAFKDN